MLFYTINDFPANGNLSEYSVKGHHVFPICEKDTSYIQLKHGRKTVYISHRRFQKPYHPYQWLKKAFNGSQEFQTAPKPLAGHQVFDRVKDIITIFGKTQKKDAFEKNIWKKRSILFELPYWSDLDVQHCIDVIHMEKNVCDSLIGTVLNIKDKTKDGLKCCQDLVDIGIWQRLHPILEGLQTYFPSACQTMSVKEKKFLLLSTESKSLTRILFKYQEPCLGQWSQTGWVEVSWLSRVNATTFAYSHLSYPNFVRGL